MFGRRRRTAPVIQAPVAPAPAELSRAEVFEHLHAALADLVGAEGAWTLVPRRSDDTDVIFHGLKAHQIAETLTELLAAETMRLRTDTQAAPRNIAEPRTDTPMDGITAVNTGALLVSSGAEPTALPWNPAPISVWAEPTSGARAGSATISRLVA
ncbi:MULTISPECIES: hypothetical protein [unclassified Cryobacterium]|uniref:hypothetical protein n=1 Tax=unclassified Cryobacterium TaxID=2649013 RepID=UPI00106D8046|nr:MULTISPECIES: hypothetical protein [unclassified Cryobacterium]TFC51034.1 hypothetical protein E3O68_16075 [Cryobacterium sp. TMB3-1-2]TFC57556.1 hypothetical protein E3O60_15960 [Cryobacterium sp. TMB1-7]TFC74380.1 hypothetical protein E3T21_02365 [Cryobacterium sp. TMB3-15]TFC79893.1 hypothetical protein E3T22_00640 [Cryobacterium sp. TMB3-10]TFC86290.1 hypothetical protein E3T19_14975 [Cryobacterium sp. TMT4-31]